MTRICENLKPNEKMEKEETISNKLTVPYQQRKLSNNSSSKSLTSSMISQLVTPDPSSCGSSDRIRRVRSKSMSNMCPNDYTPGEIRRIRERLLRTNAHLEPSAIKRFTKTQKLTLISLSLVDFMSFCSMSIMAPFFPREAAEKGLSDTMSGFVFSFYALIMFLTSPIFGKLLPKIGAKFLFLSGMFIAGACNLLFGMLEFIQDYTMFTTFCLLIRGLEALGASAFSTASYVFVVNTFPNNIGTVLGILETFIGLGMSTGPAIGGLLYSLGGFDLPFFVLGVTTILIIPINIYLLPSVPDCNVNPKGLSLVNLIKIPAVFVTGLIVIVASSTWAFLDPTLEPHLRQFNLTAEKIGLIFLLFSGLYGISSLCWGYLADKINNHWSMMIFGLFLTSFGLTLLGPSPFFKVLESSLWLNLIALSLLGVAVALTVLPTFKSVLESAVEAGFPNSVSTYSVVAGLWSCMYSLGEVIGPTMGGFLVETYGFPVTSSIMALTAFSLGIFGLLFFVIRPGNCSDDSSESGFTDSWSSDDCSEKTPLIYSMTDEGHRLYTAEKIQCYEQRRRVDNENGDVDHDQVTDVRGTIGITPKGSCEV